MNRYSHAFAVQYVIDRIKENTNNDYDFLINIAPRAILVMILEYHLEYLRSLKSKGKKKEMISLLHAENNI